MGLQDYTYLIECRHQHFYLSQHPLRRLVTSQGHHFDVYCIEFSRRTRLLFIIPLSTLLFYIFSFLPTSAIQRGVLILYTLHFITFALEPTSDDHTNYIFHTHIHYSRLKFCGEDMVWKGNWLVLAGTGTYGQVLMGGMGSGVIWLIQKVVMG